LVLVIGFSSERKSPPYQAGVIGSGCAAELRIKRSPLDKGARGMDKEKQGSRRMIFVLVETNIPLNPPSKGDFLILQNID
jgi:hypothetical protein